jgi:hypothetical protein
MENVIIGQIFGCKFPLDVLSNLSKKSQISPDSGLL